MFLYFLIVISVSSLLLLINYGLSSFVPYLNKNLPFECGYLSQQQSREPFNISFYLVGILFLLFDVEISFIYPLLSQILDINLTLIVHLSIFLFLLSIGLIYEIIWARHSFNG